MPATTNVVYLIADQQRYDAVGCNRAKVCRTPAIDAIASEGTRFARGFTPVALCSPARGSLLTGLYPHNHGLLANMGNFNGVFDRVILGRPGYPALLSEAGHQTGYVGKWHLPREGDRDYWHFDEWHTQGEWSRWLAEAGIDYEYGRDDVQRLEWGGQAPFCGRATLPAVRMQEAWCADRAVEMIRRFSAEGRPFALTVGFFGPHFPYAVPEPYDTMYDPADVPRWANFDETFAGKPAVQQREQLRWNASHLTWPDWQRVIAHYWGFCTFIDDQVARIVEALKEAGVYDRTAIVYTSDHGDMLGGHRLFNKGMNMYDETHHVPLIVRLPGDWSQRAVCDRFVSLTDLMPTLLDLCGAVIPEGIDGRSLLPLIEGREVLDWPDDVYAEFHGYESALCSIRMVRTERWKYVYNPCSEDELYDVQSDPGELHNLAANPGHGHVLRRMKARLVRWLQETGDTIAEDDSWKGSSYGLYISRREQ
jgi:arylsulfatase A-like enzyme